MKKLRIAQIGIGHAHARDILETLQKMPDRFEFVGLAVPDEEKELLHTYAAKCQGVPLLTVEEVLEDSGIRAVTIEVLEQNLTHYATLAAQKGKHIHMDKPGGFDGTSYEVLVETARENGVVLHLGYMYRYNQAVAQLLQDIRSGKLGEIVSMEAQMNSRHDVATRTSMEQYPGGIMYFLGCHLIDLLLLIRGKPDQIIPYNRSTGVDGVTAIDYGMVVFDYPNGISIAKTCSEEMGGFDRRQLVVTGSKGTVEIRPLEMYGNFRGVYTGVRTSTSEAWLDQGYRTATPPVDRYVPMMEGFFQIAMGLKENPYTYDYELMVHKAVLESCGVKGASK